MPLQPTAPVPVKLRFEHRPAVPEVIGLGSRSPRLSWQIREAPATWRQTSYEIEARRGDEILVHLVDDARGSEQILVPWPFAPLASHEEVHVRVRVAGVEGQFGDSRWHRAWGPWSEPTCIEAALFCEGDWHARFISPVGIGGVGAPCPIIGRMIEIPNGTRIIKARMRSSAHGIFALSLNGNRVGDTALDPGWTAYQHRIQYVTHDVTDMLVPGMNSIEATLADGWYRGTVGYFQTTQLYGDRLALLAQLEVDLEDGNRLVFGTDASWSAWNSAIISADLYHGQDTDLRLVAGNSSERAAVEILDEDLSHLVPLEAPPVRPLTSLTCVRSWTKGEGVTLFDFGQNAVGRLRIAVRGLEAGTEIIVRHAEVLENGELCVRPLRAARATDRWIIADGGEYILEPEFTLHGFRYAEISGVPGISVDDVEFVVLGSDLERRGWFDCSDPDIARLHENVVWSMRSNFVSIPTDCPQRDERLGWTGDIQVFAPTACFLFDTAAFLSSWLSDLAAEQYSDGSVPHVIPTFTPELPPDAPAAAWGDAAVVVPWTLYGRYGDTEILRRQFPSMRAWVDRITAIVGDTLIWSGGFQFGDWLDPSAPPEDPAGGKTDPDVVATACFARCVRILAQAAEVIGDQEVAAYYGELWRRIREAFARAFVTPEGRVHSDSQTAYAMAIEWDLLPDPEQRVFAGARLADLVRLADHRIGTGFVGTPLICDALTDMGHANVADDLLSQRECPSWLYPVTMGATTIWERWDSMLPDGSINPGGMTSFNHYALGAIADWMHRSIAGIAPLAPGYRMVLIRPRPSARLEFASAAHITPFGVIRSSWERNGRTVKAEIDIPVGVEAEVILPWGESLQLTHGHYSFEGPASSGHVRDEGARPLTVRDILDDSEAWQSIVDEFNCHRALPVERPRIYRLVSNSLDSPAELLASILTPPTDQSPEDQIDRLNGRLKSLGITPTKNALSGGVEQ